MFEIHRANFFGPDLVKIFESSTGFFAVVLMKKTISLKWVLLDSFQNSVSYIKRWCRNNYVWLISLLSPGSVNLDGMESSVDWNELFDLPKDFWKAELDNIEKYHTDQINEDLPTEMLKEIESLRQRLNQF